MEKRRDDKHDEIQKIQKRLLSRATMAESMILRVGGLTTDAGRTFEKDAKLFRDAAVALSDVADGKLSVMLKLSYEQGYKDAEAARSSTPASGATSRTDAEIKRRSPGQVDVTFGGDTHLLGKDTMQPLVSADFARQLERELDEAKDTIAQLASAAAVERGAVFLWYPIPKHVADAAGLSASSAIVPKLPPIPSGILREIERCLHDAEHPVGMSTHDGKARIDSSKVRMLLKRLDIYEGRAPNPYATSDDTAQKP